MPGEIIRVKTADNIELQGMLYSPDSRSSTAILHMPGSCGNFYENRFLDALAAFYVSRNLTFISCNNRGHNGNTAYERFKECTLDIEAWLGWLESHRIQRFILQGHSLGTQKVVYYLLEKHNEKVIGCILLAPFDLILFYKVDSDIIRKKNLRKTQKLDENTLVPKEIFDMWPISAGTYLDLLGYETKADIFDFRDDNTIVNGVQALKKLPIPVFAAIGGEDMASLPSPQKFVDALSKTSTLCGKVTSHLVPKAPHNFDGYLQELVALIEQWLNTLGF